MNDYKTIPPEKFGFSEANLKTDKKLETKHVGYYKDALSRFRRNKSSVIAFVIIMFLLIFAIIGPLLTPYEIDFSDKFMANKLPRSRIFSFLGWDGASKHTINEYDYYSYLAIAEETGVNPIKKIYQTRSETAIKGLKTVTAKYYTVRLDSYAQDGLRYKLLSEKQYIALQKYQDENCVQIIYPSIPESSQFDEAAVNQYNANNWYKVAKTSVNKGFPLGLNAETGEVMWQNNYITYSGNDSYTSKMRIEGIIPKYDYSIKKAGIVSGIQYYVRVDYNKYFKYENGVEPHFIFGTNQFGQDVFTRLSSGARFSFLLAFSVSLINLAIGAIYGAIEGYYGGKTDLIMERFSDVLSGVPFVVVITLFQLHFASKVGVVACLLFAFVLTGWIGIARKVRMQFYRYKTQEYVLAARTMGAKDGRIICKHIFPNALGTLITSCILVIPSVIFSESTLSYLGIINPSSSKITSVGALLANGQGQMQSFPHVIFFPALFISLLIISFNLFGNGLRDAFNPSLRGNI